VSRNNIIDGTLVLVTLLGAWAVLRAAETGRLRWLLLCAVLVGLGFNVKMLEAYLVVPAFGLLYLVAAPRRWTTRTWHLGVATLVLLVVSFSWAMAVDLTPASARPYVGSSGTNSEINLALGYNGLERLTGRLRLFARDPRPTPRTASTAPDTHAAGGTSSNGPGGGTGNAAEGAAARGFTRGETGNPGPLRLFNSALGGQVSWLLPLALLGLIAAAWRTRVRFPLDRRQHALVLWGTWLLVQAAFFSIAGFFHTYYMVMIAPSIAALAGIGLVALWRDYRSSGWRGWALPLALLVTAGVQAYLLSSYPGWSSWLTPLVVGFCVVAAIALAARRLGGRVSGRVALGAAALGTVGLLAAPTTWAADTLLNTRGGGIPTAGPPPQNGGDRFPGAARTQSGRRGVGGFDGRGFAVFGGFGGRDDVGASTPLVQYLEAHRGQTRYLLATLNAMTAAPIILATGQPVMALGGFSGADRIVTPSALSRLVSDGTVRFFLLNSFSPRAVNLDALPPQIRAFIGQRGGRDFGGFGGFGGGQNGDLAQWVSANCAVVPSSLWQPATTQSPGGAGSPSTGARGSGTGGFGFFGPGGGGEQLYDCTRRPSGHAQASRSTTSSAPSAPRVPATPPQALPGQGTAAPSQSRPALRGQLVSIPGGTITVQSFQGAQSLPTTTSTRYYLATPASSSALAVGQHVAVAPAFGASSGSTAASVTIAPRVDLYVSVRRLGARGNGSTFGGGGFGGFGGSGTGGPGNGGSRGFGNGRTTLTGAITALSDQTLTLRVTDGTTHTLALTTSTTVYRVVAATSTQLQAGSFVTVSAATVAGRRVATDVVSTTTAGTMASIVSSAGTTTGPTF
jgi:4-amino-4-deoxy-L-arabinose transferase-like glycosyltransferase